jgi:hypothetical protein
MRHVMLLIACLGLAACSDFEPREKIADVDPDTGWVVPPYPCPDWSQDATVNYDNSLHSNYGCAVNNNLAVQLADPWDLKEGRGTDTGNTDMGVLTIERYRAGEIPVPLTPMQDNGQ